MTLEKIPEDLSGIDQIWQQIKNKLVEMGFESSSLSLETDISLDLQIDSLALYELVVELEETFQIPISDEELENLHTFKDITLFISSQKTSFDF